MFILKAFLLGGRSWIRTMEVIDNRFTVCPIWPLWKSPMCNSIAAR